MNLLAILVPKKILLIRKMRRGVGELTHPDDSIRRVQRLRRVVKMEMESNAKVTDRW
jgi:hypothetical protein